MRDTAEQLAGQTVYRDYVGGSYSCGFTALYGETGYAARLRIARLAPPKNTPVEWPERCTYTRAYMTAVLPNLTTLPRTRSAIPAAAGPCCRRIHAQLRDRSPRPTLVGRCDPPG